MFRFFNLLTGRRWWYEVELEYRDKHGQLLAHQRTQIGLATRSEILNTREQKKDLAKSFVAEIYRHRLCNGSINFRVVAYLGWLKLRACRKGPSIAIEDLYTTWLYTMLVSRKDL